MEEKLTSGVSQLDNMLEGGLYRGSNILVRGGPGAGKTTFGLQYLIAGCREGEKTLYLTFEESKEQILRYGSRFFPDIRQFAKDQRMIMLDFSPHSRTRSNTRLIEGEKVEIPDPQVVDSIAYIEDKILDIRGQSIQRVVIDGLQTFATTFYDISEKKDMDELRRTVSKIMVLLKDSNATTYILSEESENDCNKYDFVNYVVDGVVSLKSNPSLDVRTLKIEKMRGVKHTLKPITMELKEGSGISIAASNKGI
ncbi:MAG: hypothetical protein KKD39_06470 [Candidatus Altiarchaeota archaeon]|nr:hypothetical protein [Candidatus Altiarchaeota archaeon]